MAIKAIFSEQVVRPLVISRKKNASHSLRVGWPVHPVIDPGKWGYWVIPREGMFKF